MIWWAAWAMVALAWLGHGWFDGYDWQAIGLGFITGAMLAGWACDMTGNKLPDWMRPKER